MSLLGLFLQRFRALILAATKLRLIRRTATAVCIFSICILLINPGFLMTSAGAEASGGASATPDETDFVLAEAITTKIPDKPFRVVGYYSGDLFDDPVDDLQTDKLTHIMYAFLIPRVDGGLEPLKTEEKLIGIVTKARRDGVKVFIAVGGWSYENAVLSPVFETATAERESRERLITNICEFVGKHGLDGVEIDWEYPNAETIEQYETFIIELRAALTREGKELTAALNGAWSATEGPGVSLLLSKTCLDCFDFVNIMAYDFNDSEHSPLWFANTSLDYWLNRGIPAEKLVLGMPLYALPSWMQYRDLIKLDVSNAFRDFVATDPLASYYNGLVTLREKTWIAMRKAGGVMLFDVNEDATGEYSALNMIQSVRDQAAQMNPEQIGNHVMIILDNEELIFRPDDGLGMPFIDENFRTLIPLRKAMEALGAKVSFDDVNRRAILKKDGIVVLVPADENYIVIKGNQAETSTSAVNETSSGGSVAGGGVVSDISESDTIQAIDTKAIIIENRMYVPLRAVFNAFGYSVDWREVSRAAIIQANGRVISF